MKRVAIGIGSVVVAATLAAIFGVAHQPDRSNARIASGAVSLRVQPQSTPKPEQQRNQAEAGRASLKFPGYAEALKRSHSYLEFVRSTIDAARSGDRDAQYYLGKAIAFCDETYRSHFERKGRILALDEALAYAAQMHKSNGLTQSIYDRCHDLKEQSAADFGNGTDWVARAASAGQPAAQATMAVLTFSQEAVRASGSAPGDSVPATTVVDKGADSRAQLQAAVESGDPEALWKIGVAQGFLNQSFSDKVKNQLAWWLVSCQRGYDCSSGADWIELECQDDTYCTDGISGIDYIRKGSGADWPEVQQRAQDINAKLKSRQWSELGLGS
jgi:hypothetical protein